MPCPLPLPLAITYTGDNRAILALPPTPSLFRRAATGRHVGQCPTYPGPAASLREALKAPWPAFPPHRSSRLPVFPETIPGGCVPWVR
jgi:hypothetical protein